MLKELLFLTIGLSSCAVSRTEVFQANEKTQAIMTVGQSLLPEQNEVKVKLLINGHVIESEQCLNRNLKYSVELFRQGANRAIHSTNVNENMDFFFDVELHFDGAILVKLLEQKTSTVLEEKKVSVDKMNDRINLLFQICVK
jgi:hypothetical protein